MRILNSQGMTLVEVLVASAILGILAVVMGMLFTNQARQQSQIQLQANYNMLFNSVQSQIGNPSLIYQSKDQTYEAPIAVDSAGGVAVPAQDTSIL